MNKLKHKRLCTLFKVIHMVLAKLRSEPRLSGSRAPALNHKSKVINLPDLPGTVPVLAIEAPYPRKCFSIGQTLLVNHLAHNHTFFGHS